MTSSESPDPFQILVQDIVAKQPELDTYLRPDGQERAEVARLIAAVFGKVWYVHIHQFEIAGRLRDVELETRKSIDPLEGDRISELVRALFV